MLAVGADAGGHFGESTRGGLSDRWDSVPAVPGQPDADARAFSGRVDPSDGESSDIRDAMAGDGRVSPGGPFFTDPSATYARLSCTEISAEPGMNEGEGSPRSHESRRLPPHEHYPTPSRFAALISEIGRAHV